MNKPPSIGWWPTGPHKLRWWNGKCWSWVCLDSDNEYWITRYSARESTDDVAWYPRPDSWPERSKT